MLSLHCIFVTGVESVSQYLRQREINCSIFFICKGNFVILDFESISLLPLFNNKIGVRFRAR